MVCIYFLGRTQELVALSGAHTLGSKGFGNPTAFDNYYFKILLDKPWLSSGDCLHASHYIKKHPSCKESLWRISSFKKRTIFPFWRGKRLSFLTKSWWRLSPWWVHHIHQMSSKKFNQEVCEMKILYICIFGCWIFWQFE